MRERQHHRVGNPFGNRHVGIGERVRLIRAQIEDPAHAPLDLDADPDRRTRADPDRLARALVRMLEQVTMDRESPTGVERLRVRVLHDLGQDHVRHAGQRMQTNAASAVFEQADDGQIVRHHALRDGGKMAEQLADVERRRQHRQHVGETIDTRQAPLLFRRRFRPSGTSDKIAGADGERTHVRGCRGIRRLVSGEQRAAVERRRAQRSEAKDGQKSDDRRTRVHQVCDPRQSDGGIEWRPQRRRKITGTHEDGARRHTITQLETHDVDAFREHEADRAGAGRATDVGFCGSERTRQRMRDRHGNRVHHSPWTDLDRPAFDWL
jgi:hypothetical protein